jgi:cell division septation protein DedD
MFQMAILTHKFRNEKRANEFFQKLRAKGFRPYITRHIKGLKRLYIVQYNR